MVSLVNQLFVSVQINLLWWIWMQDSEGVTEHIVVTLRFGGAVLGRCHLDGDLGRYWLISLLMIQFFFSVES